MARPHAPPIVCTSASTVGLPRLSSTSRARILVMRGQRAGPLQVCGPFCCRRLGESLAAQRDDLRPVVRTRGEYFAAHAAHRARAGWGSIRYSTGLLPSSRAQAQAAKFCTPRAHSSAELGRADLGRDRFVVGLPKRLAQLKILGVPGNLVTRLEHQVAQEEAQVERRIAVVAGLEIDHHQSAREDQQVLGAEVGMHERARMCRRATRSAARARAEARRARWPSVR